MDAKYFTIEEIRKRGNRITQLPTLSTNERLARNRARRARKAFQKSLTKRS